MAESKEDKIERLMREGLNHYGMGAVVEALRSWREVLKLDPDHAEARDFVATAEEAAHATVPPPRPKQPPAELEVHEHAAAELAHRDDTALDDLVSEGQRLVREQQLEAGLDLLEAVARRDPMRLEVHGHIEEVRSRLLKRYRDRMRDLGGVPRLSLGLSDVMKFNLPAHAGFMLSLIDGDTSVGDIVSLSGMDSFEALRVLNGLLDAGIVSLGTAARRERRGESVE
ncbi:MAG TPA: hypothetical protein VKM54_23980 [Myxococcota bacterium]|nr:hypothetical protein [Myxococcota bacterium]